MTMQDIWKSNEQRNLAPLNVPGASSAGSVRVVSGSGFRYVVPFPYRLHEMLSSIEAKHDTSIVSWLPDGKHFKVHDPKRFVETVIPSAFKQKSLKSFQRQLHLYGFQRVHEGADKGSYFHEKFRRDDRDLCLTITRTKAPKRSRAAAASKATIPKKKTATTTIMPSFQQSVESRQETSTLPHPIGSIPAVKISPTIFDDLTPQVLSNATNSIKAPLHERAMQQQPQQPTSTNPFPRGNTEQLDRSVVDTCQWLINAGVPMSAFDPVAIGDTLNSTPLTIPQVIPSATSSFTAVVPTNNNASPVFLPAQNNNGKNTVLPSRPSNLPVGSLFENVFSDNTEKNSLDPAYEEPLSFENDSLLTDFLPGEDLSLVDDSLWVL